MKFFLSRFNIHKQIYTFNNPDSYFEFQINTICLLICFRMFSNFLTFKNILVIESTTKKKIDKND